MKKAIISLVLFFVALNVAPVVNAQAFKAAIFSEDNGTVNVVAHRGGQSFDLVYQADEESKVKVNILDTRQRVVFTETVRNHDTFRRPYNLANLPSGEYTFRVTSKYGVYTQNVTVL